MRRRHRDSSAGLWLSISLLAILATGPVAAAPAVLDPVVADVVEMLQSNVDEGVVLTWLETTDRRPGDIGSQGIIALTDAGASETLITALLERVDSPAGDGATSQPAVESGVEPAEVKAPAGSPPADSAVNGEVEATFQLSAKRVWVDEDEPDRPRDPEWWVYLYLDGELVAWIRPSMSGEPVETRRVLEAGAHEMRVVLQRYEELRSGWLHESLSVPTPMLFESRPGEPIEIDVEMVRIWGLWRQRKDGGPLRFVIRQGAEVLGENTGTGGDPNRWQPVCEDVEANFPSPDAMPKRFRNPMSRCVRWQELWAGPGRSTDRAAMLVALAEYDFKPPVR